MRRALGMLGGPARAVQPSGNPDRRATSYGAPNGHANGHSGGQATPRRHRFVQDGEVPVTVMRPRTEHASDLRSAPASPVNRLDALQESLVAEQAARGVAERALDEAQTAIRILQTRLSHLELARDEALAQAKAQQASVQEAHARAEEAATLLGQAPAERQPEADIAKFVAVTDRVNRGKRQQKVERPSEPEPEPVKWWLSSQPTPAKRGRPRRPATPE